MENQEESFRYTYSAKEHAEVENIRKKYLPREEDKMEQLHRLDRLPVQKAQAWSLVVGILGALVMGLGMSFAMTELGALIGNYFMVIGIVIGMIGMALAALAYPVYNRVLNREREKIAPEILRLTDELMK